MNSTENGGAPKSGGPGATNQCGHEERISDALASETRTKYEWAQYHYAKGWSVVPAHSITRDGTCTCRRDGCSSPGKHPRIAWQEFETRRATLEELETWWRRWPDANPAGVTGEISGRDVVDIDGEQGLGSLREAGIELPSTVLVETGRDAHSCHAHFAHIDGSDVPTKAGLLAGVDTRGRGGVIMLPGSDHVSGRQYRYREGCSPEELNEAPFPVDTFGRFMRGRSPVLTSATPTAASLTPAELAYCQAALRAECARVSSALPGARNDTLNAAAFAIGSLVGAGMDEGWARQSLLDAGVACGLSVREADSTIRSGMTAGIQTPRGSLGDADHVHSSPRPPFPLHVLPSDIRKFVVEAARCVGCPPDMVAVPLLGYAAATIGRTRSIQVKPHYVKHPVFWFGMVGAPGSGKSPADGLARSFVETLQAKAYADWQTEYQEWRIEHELWKQRMKGKGSGKAKLGGESYQLDSEPEEPVLEHFYTTDSTIEALAPMLSASAGVAIAHDEIVGWVKGMGAYNGASARDRAQFLTLWAERSFKVDRRGRTPILIEDPVAVIIGGVQPDVLADLAGEADKRDGFIDRFLWSWPQQGPVPWTEDTVSSFTAAAVETIFRRLRASGSVRPVTLSEEAKAFWRAWYDENAAAVEAERGVVAGILAKADVQLARLALVLHVLAYEHPHEMQVSVETLRGAADLVAYHLAHARAVVQRLGVAVNGPRSGRGSTLRQRLIARLQEHGGWMSATDLAKGLGGHIPATARDAELARLEAEGLVEQQIKEPGELGGRPAIQWRYYARTCERDNSKWAA